MASIENIEGIGKRNGAKLVKAGVKTPASLLRAGGGRKERKALAAETGIDEKAILKWVNKADLMRVKGVGSEYSDLLEACGVDTVKELRRRSAKSLHAKLLEGAGARTGVRRPPSLSMVERWVASAKALDPAVTY